MGLDVLNPVSLKKLKGIGGFTYVGSQHIDNQNFWRAGLYSSAGVGGGVWNQLPDSAATTADQGGGIYNGKLYQLGRNPSNSGLFILNEYDLATGTNTLIPQSGNIPGWRRRFSFAMVGSKLYVCGGVVTTGAYREMWSVDVVTGVWTQLANHPQYVRESFMVAVGDLLYVYGGNLGDDPRTVYRNLIVYDTTNNTWTSKASGIIRVLDHTMSRVGDYLYVVGGTNDAGSYYNQNQRYSLLNDTWSYVASIPGARNDHIEMTLNGKFYVSCGSAGSSLRDLYEYSPDTNTWLQLAQPPTVFNNGYGAALNNKLYASVGAGMYEFSLGEVSPLAVSRFY